jgi:hypothetical protein
MLTILFGASRIDKDAIDKDNDKLIQLFHKHLVHEVHEIGGALVNLNGITVNSCCP